MKENISKIIILVQAPADIPFALDLITKYESSQIHVYVINVENNYKLLKHLLGDDTHIEFIPYPYIGYTSLKGIRRTKKEFILKWKDNFEQLSYKNALVYFFSRYEDPFTFFLIERMASKKDVRIIYVNHYDPPGQKVRCRDILYSFIFDTILFYITHAHYRIARRGKRPELNIGHYKNIYEHKTDLTRVKIERYLLSVEKTPAALFLVNPNYNSGAYDYEDYILKIKSIACALKEKGVFIYVKGHPRMGLPKELEGVYDERIEDFVISELLDYTRFSLVVGCESTAIAHAAIQKGDGVYSVLDMLKPINKDSFERVRNYVFDQSRNKVLFVTKIEEILSAYEDK